LGDVMEGRRRRLTFGIATNSLLRLKENGRVVEICLVKNN
jgi:hypothetical protein